MKTTRQPYVSPHPLTILSLITAIALGLILAGCGQPNKKDRDFHTSGSIEADQRAEQRIVRDQQLRGEGVSGAEVKKSLYERLGGEAGVKAIIDDFVPRVLADPRVNFERNGVKKGGVLGVGAKPVTWDASPANVERLKKHLAQFVSLATGGPAKYEGKDMAAAHAGMKITNAEYDASIGDLKASLDALKIPIDEQKELLAVIESTRPQIVEER